MIKIYKFKACNQTVVTHTQAQTHSQKETAFINIFARNEKNQGRDMEIQINRVKMNCLKILEIFFCLKQAITSELC